MLNPQQFELYSRNILEVLLLDLIVVLMLLQLIAVLRGYLQVQIVEVQDVKLHVMVGHHVKIL